MGQPKGIITVLTSVAAKFSQMEADTKAQKIVYKRLNQSGTTRYPMSVSRLVKVANSEEKRSKTLVVVGNVLNDERLIVVPKMNVCALRFTTAARERITAAGGRCMTFDQLAKESPKGQGTWLLRGHRSREAMRHFGSPARDGAKPFAKGSHEKKRKIKG